jgi:hypothetical protein
MKLVFAVLVIGLSLNQNANAQTQPQPLSPAATSGQKPSATPKDRAAPLGGVVCKWRGGDFSPGAEFCVFSGRALVCENGVWKHEDLPGCVVTPPVLP